jgi:GNAT superfamily N-acetyltransferase
MRMEELAKEQRRAFAAAPALYRILFRYQRLAVVDESLSETQWDSVRAFLRRTERQDLWWRFGYPLALDDDITLRRAFGIKAGGEMLWGLDEDGAIAGICHRILTSPEEAEIALIVRSDLKGFGIGEYLLRSVLARAARQGFKTLSASILRDNWPMVRLAMKVGCVLREPHGETIEIAFNVTHAAAPERSKMAGAE